VPLRRRKIALTFELGEGSFGESGADTLKLTDLRASAAIELTGGKFKGQLNLSVYGMTLSHMRRLSTLGMKVQLVRKNTITVEAGDDETGMARVFIGTIIDGWADMAAMPQAAFHVMALSGMMEAVKPVPPNSFRGVSDVATVMSSLATQANLIFTNYGVNKSLYDLYLPGTIWSQMEKLAQMANINWYHDGVEVSIWPKDGSRGSSALIISPETGMIGYPAFTALGIQLRTLFSPNIGFGQLIKVKSSLIEGDWRINALSHHLEAETPGGDWSSSFIASPPDVTVIPGAAR
jgi:hypothetical protein